MHLFADYERFVRPWIFGWRGNPDFPQGVVFEGVDEGAPTFLRGALFHRVSREVAVLIPSSVVLSWLLMPVQLSSRLNLCRTFTVSA